MVPPGVVVDPLPADLGWDVAVSADKGDYFAEDAVAGAAAEAAVKPRGRRLAEVCGQK